ncbi:hypothetical protein ACA910_000706 [Epithemia clementina (nom. ined.)]
MFYQFPDDYFYGTRGHYITPREYERYRQQKAYEEMKLRQMAEHERQERLFRLRQAELARQEREEYERRMAERQASIRNSYSPFEGPSSPKYAVVRGRDGLLYRVPVEDHHDDDEYRFVRDWDGSLIRERKSPFAQFQPQHSPRCMTLSTPNEEFVKSENKGNDTHMDIDENATVRVSNTKTSAGQAKSQISMDTNVPMTKKEKRKPKKITVIVEDVTDESDTEDNDDLKSYWRNRHPSPTESWMEPIDLP